MTTLPFSREAGQNRSGIFETVSPISLKRQDQYRSIRTNLTRHICGSTSPLITVSSNCHVDCDSLTKVAKSEVKKSRKFSLLAIPPMLTNNDRQE